MGGIEAPRYVHRPAISQFWKWQQKKLLRGVNGVPHHDDTAALSQQDSFFIPRSALKEYLTDDQIRDLLRDVYDSAAYTVDRRTVSAIKSKFLIVFAILVTIDMGQHIQTFVAHADEMDDTKLPFTDPQRRPLNFPSETTPSKTPMYAQFRQCQWRFCTEALEDDMAYRADFNENKILPIQSEILVGSGVSAVVFRVVLHEGFNNLQPQHRTSAASDSGRNVFVIKRFSLKRNIQAEEHFNREVEAFIHFARDIPPEPNLIGFHGAYIHGSSFNIILQYAEFGNLNDFLFHPARELPATTEERLAFWTQLFGIINAVDRLHAWKRDEGDGAYGTPGPMSYQGCHHDIKPSNILVAADPRDSMRHFPYRFLLADLGLVTLTKIQSEQNLEAPDPWGTRAYGPPETSRPSDSSGRYLTAKRKVDMWSLGCIFSEALVWSLLGPAGLISYRQQRLQERGGKGECFHDGTKVLTTVAKQHERCTDVGLKSTLTDNIIRHILDNTLMEADGRLDAPQTRVRAQQVLNDAKSKTNKGVTPTEGQMMEPPTPTSPPPALLGMGIMNAPPALADTQSPNSEPEKSEVRKLTHHTPKNSIQRPGSEDSIALSESHSPRREPSTRTVSIPKKSSEAPPMITLHQLEDWHERRKRHEHFELPGSSNLDRLQDRDLIFVIDDSRSMRAHWEDVKKFLKLLGYAIKGYDDDGMELIFMSGGQRHKAKNTTPFVEKVQLHSSRCTDRTNAEDCLARILDDYASKLKAATSHSPPPTPKHRRFSRLLTSANSQHVKPLSLFVFTDAVWQPKGTCVVADPIIRLLKDLRDAPKKQVGISFIQFGEDEIGTKRLRYLDEGLAAEHRVRDIVDYEPANDGNILKMLLGSIEPWFDWENNSEVEDDDRENLWCRD